jgi:hypothetical protein
MRHWLVFLAAIALATPGISEAASPEVKEAKAAYKDAKKDLKQIEKIADKWEKARASENKAKEHKIDESLKEWMKEEMQEGREDLKEARADAADADRPREVKEAEEDLEIEVRNFTRTKEVVEAIRKIQPRFDNEKAGPKNYKSKSEALKKLVVLSKSDMNRAQKEYEELKAKK